MGNPCGPKNGYLLLEFEEVVPSWVTVKFNGESTWSLLKHNYIVLHHVWRIQIRGEASLFLGGSSLIPKKLNRLKNLSENGTESVFYLYKNKWRANMSLNFEKCW